MNLQQLINKELPPLKTTDTVAKALNWMQVFKVRQLPVLKEKTFIGVIEEEHLKKISDVNLPLAATDVKIVRSFMYNDQHYYGAFTFCTNNQLEIIPVLNRAGDYLGLITAASLIDCFAQIKWASDDCSIIVLECPMRDYLLSKIINIAESNGANVLSVDVNLMADGNTNEVTMRLNNIDLARIEAGFFRHDYKITASYSTALVNPDFQDRYDSLMKYLGI